MDKMEAVYLIAENQHVEFGNIFYKPNSSHPSTELHGSALSHFAKDEEDLIVVNSVQIFKEAFNIPYPYGFKSFDDLPTTLGDMNEINFYKTSIAWDRNKMMRKEQTEYLPPKPQIVFRSNATHLASPSPFSFPQLVIGNHGNERSRATKTPRIGGRLVYGIKKRRKLARMQSKSSAEEFDGNKSDTIRDLRLREDVFKDVRPVNRPNVASIGTADDREDFDNRELHKNSSSNAQGAELTKVNSRQLHPEKGGLPEENYSSDMESYSDSTGGDDCESSPDRTRKYRYKNRRRGRKPKISAMRSARHAEAQRSDNPFLVSRRCCVRYCCFDKVDPHYAFEQYKSILMSDSQELRTTLLSWLDTTTMEFFFNGSPVCYRFLCLGFKFSFYLISSIKGTPKSRPPPGMLPRDSTKMTKRDSIGAFITNFAETMGDKMPNASVTTLPVTQKKDLYDLYLSYYIKYHQERLQEEPPTKSYFLRIWKHDMKSVKARKTHGFTKCSLCEQYRSELLDAHGNMNKINAIRAAKAKHLQFMRRERMGYYMRRDQAVSAPKRYCSFILDGADQKSYGLPHFTFSTKGDRGQKMKVKCVGVLEHTVEKNISLFLMTEEFQTGSNHIIEALHRVLNKKYQEEGWFAPTMYIQLDNCTRENKNHYLLSYLESLVAIGVFYDVQVSFLPVGHTHEDIDQVFSSLARHLRTTDAHTMKDMLLEMKQTWKREAVVAEMKCLINYSDLCEAQKCIQKVQGISQYRYFRFTRACSMRGLSGEIFKTNCHVKRSLDENWNSLRPGSNSGILREVPILLNAPPLETFPPSNHDQVLKCIEAAEERIKSQMKMKELRNLYSKVYEKNFHPLHWNEQSFEFQAKLSETQLDEVDDDDDEVDFEDMSDDEEQQNISFTYNSGSFVAVKACDSSPFWIAKVQKFSRKSNALQVLWCEGFPVNGKDDPYLNSYRPLGNSIDTISADTVHLNFDQLTKSGTMRVNVCKALRQVLAQD